MSLAIVASAPVKTSGARYRGVPTTRPPIVPGSERSLARTEVHQNQPAPLLAHHVLSLDVSMHQTGVVHGRQGPTELVPDESSLGGAERAVADQHLLERQAADELHPETDSAVVFTGSVNRDDIRVTHASQGSPLVQQSGCKRFVSRRRCAAGA